MELTLQPFKTKSINQKIKGRNPSFNGTYSPTILCEIKQKNTKSRNPSFNGTYSPTAEANGVYRPLKSRNPSFNGTYSPTTSGRWYWTIKPESQSFF